MDIARRVAAHIGIPLTEISTTEGSDATYCQPRTSVLGLQNTPLFRAPSRRPPRLLLSLPQQYYWDLRDLGDDM
jgi:hypothetical protein